MRRLLPAFALLGGLACSSEPSPSTTTSGSGGATSTQSHMGGGGEQGGGFRSELYPEGWTPAFTAAENRYLHDFSHAGYHRGAAEPGAPASAPIFDVVASFGADPSGAGDSTAPAQAAIDAAASAGGGVVLFPEGLYRIDGLLTVTASRVVIRGAGSEKSRLYFTRHQGMSDGAHLRFSGDGAFDLEIALSADGVSRGTSVEVADAGDLAPGDDVVVGFEISPEFVEEHGMTGTWQTFFRRDVVSVDKASSPPRVELDVPLRYPVKTRDKASIRRQKGLIRECGVESLGISNAVSWDDAWTVDRSHVIELRRVADCWIRDVASFPSPIAPASGPGTGAHFTSGGILVSESKRVTVSGVSLGLAQNRGGGGNGYLFEIQRSSEILTRDSVADGGRHNFIQNWGFGTTGCVWLRVESRNGVSLLDKDDTLNLTGLSEFHHSLATGNLVDSSVFDDGFSIVNRDQESTGAGHTGTENVLWNLSGAGTVRSLQFGTGYLIGTQGLYPVTESPLPMGFGTAPTDWVEGLDRGADLRPPSLYEDQLARRLGP